jgi:Outer membrane protein Omp28
MKKLLMIMLAMSVAFVACKKDDEPEVPVVDNSIPSISHSQKQVPIVYKSTGETCYYCGDWGWQAWIDLADDHLGTALTWANYSTGFSNAYFRDQEMNPADPTMEAIKQNFGSGGKPNFYVNGTSYSTSTSNAASAAAASIASTSVVASASIAGTLESGVLTVDAEAKFYSAVSGEYYMGVYVIENYASGPQAGPIGTSGDVDHHLVMRGSMTSTSAWGVQIVSASAAAGSTFAKTYTVTLPATYNEDNINVGVIIWKKSGSTYSYVNAATNIQ